MPGLPRGASSATTPAFSQASARSSASRGSAPVEHPVADQPALRRLVEVADHRARAVGHLLQHADRHRARRDVAGRLPEGGVRPGAQVDHEPTSGSCGHGGGERVAPHGGEAAEPGEHAVAGEPVRRDAVAEAQRTEQRAGHDDRALGTTLRRRVERAEVEGVVEHARVDASGGGGGRCEQCGVAGDLVVLTHGEPQRGAQRLGVAAREVDEPVEHALAGARELRERQGGEVEGLAAAGGGLALGGRQQHEHGVDPRPRGGASRTRVNAGAGSPCRT